ncbi:hypothetical protein Ait01nite_076140 [Actinoplanes italicus]|uniref:Uncharacterized protein n=1 Tax=Actinoplanes italicus TaxID=113567 RepID=A0A2T0JYU0_9ACTN|nr:ankyrin repeat domain-containing protein [Actinoplanes italicus]PRX14704.1 hypothetical protein CLV67_12390 [Actinoplanes italicus]GIE34569.1 hypothetical protein Ait01nite_076140 [Actinoplanes italicus]
MSGHDPLALADWQRIRRYAVPTWMIAECTEARERGDWRAACEAALVDVRVDDPAPVAELLAGLAPDLLRWHLPRALGGSTELAGPKSYVLAPDGPVGPGTPVLVARVPPRVPGADPLILEAMPAGAIDGDLIFPVPSYLWDARRAAGLGAVARPSAGSAPRPASIAAARPPGSAALPSTGAAGGDLAACLEEWTAAGWSFGDDDSDDWRPREAALLSRLDPVSTAGELRRVTAQFGRRSWGIWADHYREELRFRADGDRLRITTGWNVPSQPNSLRAVPCLHPGLLRPSIDLDLLQRGLIGPDDLHPLVRGALFPRAVRSPALPSAEMRPAAGRGGAVRGGAVRGGIVPVRGSAATGADAGCAGVRSAGDGTAVPVDAGRAGAGFAGGGASARPVAGIVPTWFGDEERIRVRCGNGWHRISVRNGRLALPEHTEAERGRERTLRALGGVSGGCFNAELAWNGGGDTPPPKRLRAYRRDLWLRMRHGGTRTVLALLDAGMDPHIRDGRGRTLLHRMHGFDHVRLLPRLLAEGLDVNTRDRVESTPLFEAVMYRWPPDLVIALVEAGADPRLKTVYRSPLDVLDEIESSGSAHGDRRWHDVTTYVRERA